MVPLELMWKHCAGKVVGAHFTRLSGEGISESLVSLAPGALPTDCSFSDCVQGSR